MKTTNEYLKEMLDELKIISGCLTKLTANQDAASQGVNGKVEQVDKLLNSELQLVMQGVNKPKNTEQKNG